MVLLGILCFQRYLLDVLFYFTAAGAKCHVAAVKRHGADYILQCIFFGIFEPVLVTLKIEYRLSRR